MSERITIDLTTLSNYDAISTGVHDISVQAVADGYTASDLSETVHYGTVLSGSAVTLPRLKEFLTLAKSTFGLKKLATKHRTALDDYILNLDYESELAFDTSLIVSDDSIAVLGVGRLGFMILG